MSFVLIHGGSMNALYWDRLVPLLSFDALAVDLPGRRSRPADLSRIRIADWVDSVVADIERAGLEDIVLVGNSLAGITMPGVAARLPDRVRHVVFSSCTVPAEGGRAADILRADIRESVLAMEEIITSADFELPESLPADLEGAVGAAECVGEDAPPEILAFLEDPRRRQLPEAMGVLFETFSWAGFPPELPRTYLKNARDRVVPPDLQDVMIGNIGGARVIELDSPHCPAVRHPEAMARILDGIAAETVHAAGGSS